MRRPVLVVEHESICSPGLFGEQLAASSIGTEVVRPYLSDPLPRSPEGYAGLVVLGGGMAAWEDDVAPWLPATRALLAGAVTSGVPTLGICLGAQLLALACGGTVERGDAGPEVGQTLVRPSPAADADPYFGAVGDRLGASWLVRHFHRDAVTVLPPDAELLVSGDRYPNQGFRVGESAWAVQYHPEVTTAGFAAWVQRAGRADRAAVMESVARAGPGQEQVAVAHAAAFAALLG